MSFLRNLDLALDKLFAPKVDKFQVLEDKFNALDKQTFTYLETKINVSEDKIVKNTTDLITCSLKTFEFIAKDVQNVKEQVNSLILAIKETKETIDATKARIEKLEVSTGMYRKVDPTKPPVAKHFTEI